MKRLLLLVVLVTFSLPRHGLTQQPSADPARTISIVHTVPSPQELPYPGQPITLMARLTNTRETGRPLRVALVKDGKFLDLDAKEAYLDENDRPTYKAVIPAPIGDMSYQFILYAPDGTALISSRYQVRRNCLPNISLAEGEVPADVRGVERLRRLYLESEALKNDLIGYEQVLKVVAELQEAVKG